MVQIPRLYFPEQLTTAKQITLGDNQHHYLSKVLRLSVGSPLTLFNSVDGLWKAEINNIDKSSTKIELLKLEAKAKEELGPTLYFAPIKNVTASFIVQKATELGVSNIQPIRTRYSVVDKINIDKLKLIAVEAAEQCERFSIPHIHNIIPLVNIFLKPICNGPLLFCNENQTGEFFSEYCFKNKPLEAGIIIGPEGGFSEEEVKLLTKNSINLQLGQRILRSETAIISALSIYQAIVEKRN